MKAIKTLFLIPLLISFSFGVYARSEDTIGHALPDSSKGQYILVKISHEWPYEVAFCRDFVSEIDKYLPRMQVKFDYLCTEDTYSFQSLCQILSSSFYKDEGNPAAIVLVGMDIWMAYRETNPKAWNNIPVILANAQDSLPVNSEDYFSHGLSLEGVAMQSLEESAEHSSFRFFSVIPKMDYYACIRMIKKMYPDVTSVCYYCENCVEDAYNCRELRKAAERTFGFLEVTAFQRRFLSDRKVVDSICSVSQRGNCVVVMREGYDFLEGIPRERLGKPVFVMSDCRYADNAVIGGIYPVRKINASLTAYKTYNIISNPDYNRKISRQPRLEYGINQSLLEKYGLSKDITLNENEKTVFYNVPDCFFKRHFIFILIFGFLLLSALIFIAAFMIADANRLNSKKLIAEFRRLYDRSMMVYNNLPLAVAQYSPKGDLISETPVAKNLFMSYEDAKSLNRNCFLNKVINRYSIDNGFSRSGFENTVTAGVQNMKYFRIIFYPIVSGGKTIKYLLLVLDTTRLEQQRMRLEGISRGFEFAMKQIKAGVIEYSSNGEVVFSTNSWYSLLNISKSTALEDSFSNLEEDDRNEVMKFLDNADPDVSMFGREVKVWNGANERHSLFLRFNRADSNDYGYILKGMVQNIDEDVTRADAIRKSMEKARESDLMKSKFVANMSHEIKTPLNAIVGFSDLLVSTDDPKEREMYVHFISENNRSLLALIDSIIDVPSSDSKSISVEKDTFDLNDMIEDIVLTTTMKVDPSKIKVYFEKGYSSMPLYQDRNKLKQVVSNFAGNAAKYTKKGMINIGYTLDDGGWITIFVSDTGIGISEENQKTLFDRFVRVDDDSSVEGYGLGLSIVKQISDAIGGQVGVTSKMGAGSKFWIRIKREVRK
ncbi:MAG: HAMP domain-containing histidine kinase [Bacteroidales bacterium]|jgi:signal transduction histidine kinase|nr:HAMP domain-containing histidine kinase [Bacteroidales bacterium]MCI2121620.1 HAMP domain-containing histidine kinase [Bacteroidales bacterium]MCI2144701.1 HAMP domain-containing histidine kinase [Bacteroidales bacterium]